VKDLFRRLAASEKVQVAFGFLILLLIFFWKVIFRGKVLLPADLLYTHYPWRGIAPKSFVSPSNGLLSDQVFQFYPWLKYARETLRQGILPLWNPYSGCGVPFLANYQSAVFYPLNFLFFLLPFKSAYGLSAMVKLFLAGFFTHRFAREISLGKFGALIAALVFMFSGFLIVWLGHPLSNVAIWLPLLFLLIERLLKQGKLIDLFFLSLVTGIQFLGGHIETSFHILVVLGFYLLFALVVRSGKERVSQRLRKFSLVFLGIAMGVLLAAIQIIPFLEYLRESWSFVQRAGLVANPYYLPGRAALTLLVPNFYGNPVANNFWGFGPNMNYSEITGYLGLLPLLLAIVALLRIRESKALFFFFLTLVSLLIVYGVSPLFEIVTSLPLFNMAANSRLLLMSTFSLSLLAGMGGDLVINPLPLGERPRVRGVIPLFLIIPSSLAALALLISAKNNIALGYLRPPMTEYVFRAIYLFLSLLLSGIFLLTAYLRGWIRLKIFQSLVILFIAVELVAFGINYNPAIEAKYVFPEPNLIKFLKKDHSLFRVISLGDTMLLNTGMAYQLSDPRSFDALTPRRLQEFLSRAGRFSSNFQMTRHWHSRLFDLLNVKYVVTDPEWKGIEAQPDISQNKSNTTFGEIYHSQTQGQTFVSRKANLSRIDLKLATYGRINSHRLIFHLRENPDSDTDLVTIPIDQARIKDNSYQIFAFPPIKDSKNRSFYFFLESPASHPGDAVTVWATSKDRYPGGQRYFNGKPTFGDLTFGTFYSGKASQIKLVYKGKDGLVYENTSVLPRAYIVHKAVVLRDGRKIIQKLSSPAFNPGNSVILEEEPKQRVENKKQEVKSSRSKIIKYQPNRILIQTSSKQPGFLVLSESFYPGWKASIDGKETKIYRANYFLRAVYLPEGEHKVEFVYEPLSFKIGLFVSLLALLMLASIWPLSRLVLNLSLWETTLG